MSVADLQCDVEQAAACRALWSAVLFDALATLKLWRRDGKNALEGRKAEQWLLHADERGVGSFAWVCQVLGIDPVAARERLRCQFKPLAASRAERLAEAV